MQWDPKQYNIFKQQRREPFDQLVQLVLPHRRPDMRVVDLGCGTGEWTRALHHTLGASETIGIDSSPEMLEKARLIPISHYVDGPPKRRRRRRKSGRIGQQQGDGGAPEAESGPDGVFTERGPRRRRRKPSRAPGSRRPRSP